MIDCTNKSKSACAVAHYNTAVYYIQNGESLIKKQLYLSAKIEFMQAVCRLEAAKILLKQAKLNNFQDYQIVIQFGLKKRIEEKINFCDRRINFLRWKNTMKLLFENWRQYLLLSETQILVEGRISDTARKYPELAKKREDLDGENLLDVIIAADPSGNQKYLIGRC